MITKKSMKKMKNAWYSTVRSSLWIVALVVIFLVLDLFTTPLVALACALFAGGFVLIRDISRATSRKLSKLCNVV